MKLTIRELYETLQELEESGLLDASDGEVTVVYQPSYPLSESATGVGFIVKDGTVELVIGAGAESNGYATEPQTLAFTARGDELVDREDDDEE